MGDVKFSVVIPSYNRREQVVHAARSVLSQTYDGPFEVIIVDDGSTDGTKNHCFYEGIWDDDRVHYLEFPENRGRVAARNHGTAFASVTGEWIVWLDSDDTLHPKYLETFAAAIRENPDAKLFTCGAAVYSFHGKWFRTRDVFVPEKGSSFKSGKIGTGSFVFHKDIYVPLPDGPESKFAYGGPGSFSGLVQRKYPDIMEMYGQNHEGQYLPLGNPFADDWCAFYLMTRENQPIGINLPLYVQSVRK